MKKYMKFAFGAMLSMIFSCSFGQTAIELTPHINYNHENKLRFEWPVLSRRKCCNLILETKDYVNLIVNNLEKIEAGIKINEPTIITISKIGDIGKIDIDRSKQSLTYLMKDTHQIFVGFHYIKILTDKQNEIRIYFDEVKNLNELSELNFDSIFNTVSNNIKNELEEEWGIGTKEFVYHKKVNEQMNSGIIKRDKIIAYGSSMSIGIIGGYNQIGLGSNIEISRVKYLKNNSNLNSLDYKISLQMKSYTFSESFMSTYGINFLGANTWLIINSGFELAGMGVGYFNYSEYNSGLVQDGIYISTITESKKIFFSFDTYLAFRNKEIFSYNTLTLGIKIF